jgi:hypothetical protein
MQSFLRCPSRDWGSTQVALTLQNALRTRLGSDRGETAQGAAACGHFRDNGPGAGVFRYWIRSCRPERHGCDDLAREATKGA